MRPPLFAEEYKLDPYDELLRQVASMRPPLFAEEYQVLRAGAEVEMAGFNEASAVRGGIRERFSSLYCGGICFNEASAVRGGIQVKEDKGAYKAPAASMRPPLFAEEYQVHALLAPALAHASMRPPLFAEEYKEVVRRSGLVYTASMRPPLFAEEYDSRGRTGEGP